MRRVVFACTQTRLCLLIVLPQVKEIRCIVMPPQWGNHQVRAGGCAGAPAMGACVGCCHGVGVQPSLAALQCVCMYPA